MGCRWSYPIGPTDGDTATEEPRHRIKEVLSNEAAEGSARLFPKVNRVPFLKFLLSCKLCNIV